MQEGCYICISSLEYLPSRFRTGWLTAMGMSAVAALWLQVLLTESTALMLLPKIDKLLAGSREQVNACT